MEVGLPSDQDVLLRCVAGEHAALSLLYQQHGTIVFHVALRLTGSTADAEDVVQDVFVGLPRALRSFRAEGSFAGWLRRIAVTRTLMVMRRRHARGETALVQAAGSLVRSHGLVIETRIDLLAALAQLTSMQRQVLILHDVEGLSHDEIAAAVGISREASTTCLHRARRMMLRHLNGGCP